MGNNFRGIRLLNNRDCSYHVQLDKSAAIDLTERKFERTPDGKFIEETWKASYTLDGSTCVLSLVKTRRLDKINGERLDISLCDKICESSTGLHVQAQRAEAGFLEVRIPKVYGDLMWIRKGKTVNACGGDTETTVFLYGSGARWGLFVLECKKKNISDQNPYMGTVAHYFATHTGNVFSTTDIGLSVVAKIRSLDDDSLDYAVEGPIQHPAAALFFMFNEVFKTLLWKPTACPHCANNSIIQKQGSMFWQSESEDSDNLPAARPHSRQNAAGVLGNDGVINGNHNGNLFVNRLSLRGR